MPRIPNKNPRYRTKIELCSDIAFVLSSSLHYGTKYAVLSEATWVWTEFEGKYEGCEHWSEAAWEFRGQPKLLVHEHIIPKKIVIGQLFQIPSPSASSVSELLASHCKAAVITRVEDARLNSQGLRSKMPPGWTWNEDVWARYRIAAIRLHIH